MAIPKTEPSFFFHFQTTFTGYITGLMDRFRAKEHIVYMISPGNYAGKDSILSYLWLDMVERIGKEKTESIWDDLNRRKGRRCFYDNLEIDVCHRQISAHNNINRDKGNENRYGLIMVVDSTYPLGLEYAENLKKVLDDYLAVDRLREAVLLVLATKQDLPNAVSIAEITERLGLHSLSSRTCHIQATCAKDRSEGFGIIEGMNWLRENLSK